MSEVTRRFRVWGFGVSRCVLARISLVHRIVCGVHGGLCGFVAFSPGKTASLIPLGLDSELLNRQGIIEIEETSSSPGGHSKLAVQSARML